MIKNAFPNMDFKEVYFVPIHWHRSIEFSYVRKGCAIIRINSDTQKITEGNFLIVNHSELHEVHNEPGIDSEVICFIISYDFLKTLIPDFDQYYFKFNKEHPSYLGFQDKFLEIISYYNDKKNFNYLKILGITYDLVYDLINYHSTKVSVKRVSDQQLIKDIIDFIHDHYQEDISLSLISKHFNFSNEHFSRLFKSKFNTSYLTYLTDYRIYCAFPEVLSTNMTIDAIASKHGFPNTKAFIEQFKKRYQLTPNAYRKKHEISIIDHKSVS